MSTTISTLSLGPHWNGAHLTPEEFDACEDWEPGYRYELINGVLIVSPPPSEGERGPNEELHGLLRDYWKTQDSPPYYYTLPEHTVVTHENRRRADRVIWAGLDRFPNVREDQPTIVVEFVSADRRDRIRDYETKRQEYLSVGIQEYWIIDRFARQMLVVRQTNDGFTEHRIAETERYATKLLPDFELPLSRLFEIADQLRDRTTDA